MPRPYVITGTPGNAVPPGGYAKHLVPILEAVLDRTTSNTETCSACGCLCAYDERCPRCHPAKVVS